MCQQSHLGSRADICSNVLTNSERGRWVVIILAVCFWIIWSQWATFFLGLTSWAIISNTGVLYDFFNLYQDGRWWLSAAYINPQTHSLTYPFAYPPSSLPFFGFFALFSFGLAAQLWLAMSIAVFVIALLSLGLLLKSDRRYLFLSISALFFFTSYPLQVELRLGQINLLIGSLTVLSLVSQRLRHRFVSAALLAVGTLMKGPPILFLIYFVVFRRDLRYLVDFLTSMMVILGLSLFVVPIQLYWYWLVNVVPSLFVASGSLTNESITGLISLSGLTYLTPGILLGAVCLYASFAFYVNSDRFKGSKRWPLRADAMFLMNTLALLILGSRVWSQDYVWVILPVALFLSGLIMEEMKLAYFAFVGVAAFLFNFNTYPFFAYFIPQSATVIPMAIIGNLLMIPALIMLYVRPSVILRDRARLARSK